MRLWPYAVLLLEVLVFFRRVLFWPGSFVIPWDFQYYAFNQVSFLAASLRAGEFPLWDPYTYCGMAFFANIQSQVFYPPTLLTALAAYVWGAGRLMHFMTIELALHVLLAGVFTYWTLRFLACAPAASLLGASAFQLGCYFASQTQHFGAITGAAWLPLSVFAILVLAERPTLRWTAILALSLALPILAGYPSTISAAFLGSAIVAIALVAARQARVGLLLSYAAGAAGAAALASIQLGPTLQIAAISVSKYRGDWRGIGSGIRLEALPSLLWPNWFHILDLNGYNLPFNFTFLYLYCGLITLLLAAAALANRIAIPFAALAAVSAVFMLGDSTGPGSVLLPHFHDLTHDSVYPEFMMVGFSLGIALLAGLGADHFSAKPALVCALLILVIADLTYFGSSRPMNTRSLKDEPGITPTQFDGSRQLLATVRGFTNASNPPARLETYGDAMGWTSMAPTIEIPTANGNDPFALNRFMDVRRKFTGGERWGRYYEVTRLDSPVLDALNVRYVISRKPLPAVAKLRLVASPAGHYLYENSAALPRFYLAQGQARDASSPVRVITYLRNRVVLETDCAQDRSLITSEEDYPGWRAFVDGREVPIALINGAFRGLRVPAGHHRIEFRFRPAILWWSGGISATALLLVTLALYRRRLL